MKGYTESWERDVILAFDECKIQGGLVIVHLAKHAYMHIYLGRGGLTILKSGSFAYIQI